MENYSKDFLMKFLCLYNYHHIITIHILFEILLVLYLIEVLFVVLNLNYLYTTILGKGFHENSNKFLTVVMFSEFKLVMVLRMCVLFVLNLLTPKVHY